MLIIRFSGVMEVCARYILEAQSHPYVMFAKNVLSLCSVIYWLRKHVENVCTVNRMVMVVFVVVVVGDVCWLKLSANFILLRFGIALICWTLQLTRLGCLMFIMVSHLYSIWTYFYLIGFVQMSPYWSIIHIWVLMWISSILMEIHTITNWFNFSPVKSQFGKVIKNNVINLLRISWF